MTRVGKKEERRNRCPRRTRAPSPKTGPKKDNLPKGYREHTNVLENQTGTFIGKVK